MRHISDALNLFRRHPRLRTYIVKPLMWSALLYLAILIGGYFLFARTIGAWLTGAVYGGGTIAALAYLVLWVFLSGIVFLGITSLLSSLSWDRLSVEVEELTTGSAPRQSFPRSTLLADSLARTALSLGMGLAAFCCGLIVPVVGPIIIAGIVAILDFTASAFTRRGVLLGGQFGKIRGLPQWPLFLIVGGLLTLIPFVNVLMMPIMVAAGTIMVARSNSTAPPRIR